MFFIRYCDLFFLFYTLFIFHKYLEKLVNKLKNILSLQTENNIELSWISSILEF